MNDVEDGEEMTAKKGHHFQRQWLKKVVRFFQEKIRWHPSIAAPGDANLSDATAHPTPSTVKPLHQ